MSFHRNHPAFHCLITLAAAAVFLVLTAVGSMAEERSLSSGQTVYVPAYSHIYQGSLNRPFNLTVLLSIRNVSPIEPIIITSVEYYDDSGDLVRAMDELPVVVPPMATKEYLVAESDDTGGSGANFVVAWEAQRPVPAAHLESVMISTRSSQGISFRCPGVVIKERSK
ncbi:DUF3124 domain-containing protein [Oceanidesulfovibrio marinus]|uniref:DUF3124 domain-containing protein n=1 Tax=Oceanidesulfovibrio marinus TaxID=370038 RepID=A0A6P1ZIY7_9BACT|nr:DUF3124 domain-containing protein [Oceanidesulfovibrio marinus]TVM35234.1 hypothetical protein DQK91_07520 [Oceanidesulfovibrio marinus]